MSQIPHSIEAEQAILGICINSQNGCYDEICEQVRSPDSLFWDIRNQELWRRIEKLSKSGRQICMTEVVRTKSESAVESEYITEICNKFDLGESFLGQYVKDAVRFQRRRCAMLVGMELASCASNQSKSIEEAIQVAEQTLMSGDGTIEEERTIASAINTVTDGWDYARNKPKKRTGIETGIEDFDNLTWGLQNKTLTILGARPSHGKTALIVKILSHCCLESKIPALFFSLEDSMDNIVRRIVCQRARLDASDLRAGIYHPGDIEAITAQMLAINKSPLTIDDRGGLNISQIRSIARRKVRKHGVKLIALDYLQKIKPASRQEKRTYEIGEVTEGLKEMAKELDVPVICAAQLNRESDKEKGRTPRPSDLGDSGMIERDADLIALLQRVPDMDSYGRWGFDLVIAKQRDGKTAKVPLMFTPKFTRFDPANEPEPEPDPDANQEKML